MPRRLFDIFPHQVNHYPLGRALSGKLPEGGWRSYSSYECAEIVASLSAGFYALGLRPGDKIGLISPNKPEFTFIDQAAMRAGLVVIPAYTNISLGEYEFIFRDSGISLLFVNDAPLADRLKEIIPNCPALRHVYTIRPAAGLPSFDDLLKQGREADAAAVNQIAAGISPDALATIIYTSGTQGTPKGVMLSHANILSNVAACADALEVVAYDSSVSVLPMSHIYERMVCFLFMSTGIYVHFLERPDQLGEAMREVKPRYVIVVPRLVEVVYNKIMDKRETLSPGARRVFDWAVSLAERYSPGKNQGLWYYARLWLARRLVFSKWSAAMGGNLKLMVNGGAALNPLHGRIFAGAGIPLREGYGQTESSPVIAVNRLPNSGFRIGTVGPPLNNVKVKIAADGEICIKGPNVMMGYYNRPDLTAEAIDADGWLHTGDVGRLIDGFLKITDRKKELFKTSSGKYISPQSIESAFKEHKMIAEIMVVGENQKTISALIVPDSEALAKWAQSEGISYSTEEELLKDPRVIKKYAALRDQTNARFSDVEKVKRFELVKDHWSVDTGELTPSLKVKRRVIMERYKSLIDSLYNG